MNLTNAKTEHPRCLLCARVLTKSYWKFTKRIFHGVMVRIGKVEPEGWPVRSGPSFSEVQITNLPEESTFPILANDSVIDYFSCNSSGSFDAIILHVYIEWHFIAMQHCYVAWLKRKSSMHQGDRVFYALTNLGIPLSDRQEIFVTTRKQTRLARGPAWGTIPWPWPHIFIDVSHSLSSIWSRMSSWNSGRYMSVWPWTFDPKSAFLCPTCICVSLWSIKSVEWKVCKLSLYNKVCQNTSL